MYNCPQNAYGQPADVIACINSVTILADCKVCTGRGFSFLRIEENQRHSMQLFEERTNQSAMFVFQLPEKDVYFIEWTHLKYLIDTNVHFLSNDRIRMIGHPLEELYGTTGYR